MWSLEDRISEANIGDLLRVVYTDKEYAVFDISVFNVGSVTKVICTNNWEKYESISDDGYSFIIPLYTEEIETIKAYLCKIFPTINPKTYTYDQNKLNRVQYSKLKALHKANHNIY